MIIRYLKISFVVFISLLCLIYATQNVTNLEACYQAFADVMGNVGHETYPSSFGPAITSPILIWLTLALVVGLEYAAGFFAAKGAWDMWTARSGPAETFNASKKFALVGCGLGIVIWMGLFAVVGGAFFQMWQTAVGNQSLEGAFQFFGACALVFVIVNMADE